jgi:hypothetical protein
MRKNFPITNSKMTKFVEIYNNSINESIGISPHEMPNNKLLEVDYIFDKIAEQQKIECQPNYNLNVGNHVRFIQKKQNLKKTRYKVSPFYFIITDISDKSITISAEDGTVITVTISQIIPLKSNKINLKWAKTIPDSIRGSVVDILKYYPKKTLTK